MTVTKPVLYRPKYVSSGCNICVMYYYSKWVSFDWWMAWTAVLTVRDRIAIRSDRHSTCGVWTVVNYQVICHCWCCWFQLENLLRRILLLAPEFSDTNGEFCGKLWSHWLTHKIWDAGFETILPYMTDAIFHVSYIYAWTVIWFENLWAWNARV